MESEVDKWIEERARTRYGRLDCGEAVHFMSALRSMRPLIEACVEQHLDNCMTVHFPGGGSAKRGGCEICAALRAVLGEKP